MSRIVTTLICSILATAQFLQYLFLPAYLSPREDGNANWLSGYSVSLPVNTAGESCCCSLPANCCCASAKSTSCKTNEVSGVTDDVSDIANFSVSKCSPTPSISNTDSLTLSSKRVKLWQCPLYFSHQGFSLFLRSANSELVPKIPTRTPYHNSRSLFLLKNSLRC